MWNLEILKKDVSISILYPITPNEVWVYGKLNISQRVCVCALLFPDFHSVRISVRFRFLVGVWRKIFYEQCSIMYSNTWSLNEQCYAFGKIVPALYTFQYQHLVFLNEGPSAKIFSEIHCHSLAFLFLLCITLSCPHHTVKVKFSK